MKPTSLVHLEAVVREVWEVLKKLLDRIPRLCKAVVAAEEGYFDEKYAPRLFKNQAVY